MKLKDYTYKGRIIVKNKTDFISIRIPMNRNLLYLTMLVLATIVWSISLFFLIDLFLHLNQFLFKAITFLAFVAWVAIGLAGVSVFIWIFFGRERIIVNNTYFITEKPLIFFYRNNIYPINDITNIRIDKEMYKINRNGEWIESFRNVIKFDTPKKIVVFARNISTADAEFILFQLAKCNYLKSEQFAVIQK